MKIRKLAVVPVVAALALAAPVASANAQATGPGSMIPCYPEPAFCGPNGQPWFPWSFGFHFPWATPGPILHFGPGPVQLP